MGVRVDYDESAHGRKNASGSMTAAEDFASPSPVNCSVTGSFRSRAEIRLERLVNASLTHFRSSGRARQAHGPVASGWDGGQGLLVRIFADDRLLVVKAIDPNTRPAPVDDTRRCSMALEAIRDEAIPSMPSNSFRGRYLGTSRSTITRQASVAPGKESP